VAVEDLDHFREVCERTGQAVDLIDQDHIDELVTNVGQQALQCQAFHAAAREPAVVISSLYQAPTFTGLALDERFARVSLRMERVEALLQSFLG